MIKKNDRVKQEETISIKVRSTKAARKTSNILLIWFNLLRRCIDLPTGRQATNYRLRTTN
jgi:hypothetical protein